MSELVDKLHYKLDGTTDEITLYSTLGEVNNKGLNVKVNGINAYAGYGSAINGEASRMNYKPPTEVAQKVLKQAGESVLLNLSGYRNNEDLLQALPVTQVTKGSYVHFNNENAPTVSGYDFVCAVPNCFIAEEDTTVKIYYIPSSVIDNTRTDWQSTFRDNQLSGDLSKDDTINTYSGTNFYNMFYGNSNMIQPPKLNMSNATRMEGMFQLCSSLGPSLDMRYYDLSNVTHAHHCFNSCLALEEINFENVSTANILNFSNLFRRCSNLTTIKGSLDLSSAILVTDMFIGCTNLKNVHLKNVPRTLDLSNTSGIEGETYIIDNYID